MRIIEKFLYGIVGIVGILLLLIILCHFNPGIAENIGESVQAKESGLEISEPKKPEKEESNLKTVENGLGDKLSIEYEIPDENLFEIPQKQLVLNGYEPVKEQGKQISEQRAQDISATLDVGNTGEDYVYDQRYYPYYDMLDEDGQELYRQLHGNTDDLISSFKPVGKHTNAAELKNAFTALICDHPELFWLDTSYGYKFSPQGDIVEIDLKFNYTSQSIEESKEQFDKAAKEIIYGSRGLIEPYEKEKYVHDALAKKIFYDLNAPINQSAYSALVQNRTVCAGYARAFQYIMQKLEVPCYYCMGYAGQNHAWNIIKLEDDYYNVDVTWDDTDPLTYDYFNCSDKEYAKNHVRRDLSIYLPPCTGTKYSDLEPNPEEIERKKQEEAEKQKKQLEKEQEEQNKEKADKKEDKDDHTDDTSKTEGNGEQIKINFKRSDESDEVIFTSIKDYYTDCAQAMMDDDDNSISFYNIVADEKLWKEIKRAYEKGDYSKAYMERVLADKHKSTCQASVTGQKLDDGTYLIRHTMIIK